MMNFHNHMISYQIGFITGVLATIAILALAAATFAWERHQRRKAAQDATKAAREDNNDRLWNHPVIREYSEREQLERLFGNDIQMRAALGDRH